MLGYTLLLALFLLTQTALSRPVALDIISLSQQLSTLQAGTTASSQPPDCQPQQIHIALTGNSTEMRVSWKTNSHNCESKVSYWRRIINTNNGSTGTDSQSSNNNSNNLAAFPFSSTVLESAGGVNSYSGADMCASPARDNDIPPLYLHTTILDNLKPGAVYNYQITLSDRVLHFRAATTPSPSHPLTFVVYGDMGESQHTYAKCPGAQYTIPALGREVETDNIDLVWHLGDISYANGRHEVWEAFLEDIEPIASSVPYHVGIGNHEYDYERSTSRHGRGRSRRHIPTEDASGEEEPYSPDWGNYGNDSGGECGVPVVNRFPMPGYSGSSGGAYNNSSGVFENSDNSGSNDRSPRANSPFWYSWEQGPVHFLTISTEHSLRPGSVQYRFIEWDLNQVDRCRTPWLFIGMHRPMYVPNPHKSNRIVADHIRTAVEQLFNTYKVDMVFSGHVHSYGRTCNVVDEQCVDEKDGGMVHVTVGTGGKRLSSIAEDQPMWLDAAFSEYGYGRVSIESSSTALFEFVRAEDGEVIDWVKLHNDRSRDAECFASPSTGYLQQHGGSVLRQSAVV